MRDEAEWVRFEVAAMRDWFDARQTREVATEGGVECYYCKGKLVRGTSSYYVKRHNYHSQSGNSLRRQSLE